MLILLFNSLKTESTLQKLDGLRQEVRNADRKKREVSFFSVGHGNSSSTVACVVLIDSAIFRLFIILF